MLPRDPVLGDLLSDLGVVAFDGFVDKGDVVQIEEHEEQIRHRDGAENILVIPSVFASVVWAIQANNRTKIAIRFTTAPNEF